MHDPQSEIQISILRCYFHDDPISTTPCSLCDVSIKAYAGVVWRQSTVHRVKDQSPRTDDSKIGAVVSSLIVLARLITVVSDDLKLILPQFDLK